MKAFSGWFTGSLSGCRLGRVAAALVAVLLAGLLTAASGSAAPPRIALLTGQDAAWPDVRGWDRFGEQAQQIAPWGLNPVEFSPYSTYQHGVRVAVGDVNGDGRNEIVTAPAQGGVTELRVFDGTTFKQLAAMTPAASWNGAFVTTGDVNGDGRAEIIDGQDAGCCTMIHVVDATTGVETAGFWPYDPTAQVGVRVATADLSGDGKAEILAVRTVGETDVSVFGTAGGKPIRTYETFGSDAVGGVSIATGDVLGDPRPELVAAANTAAGVQVKVIDTQSGAVAASLLPYAAAAVAPPQVAVADVNGDGRADIIVLAQLADGTQVKVLDADGSQLDSFYVLEPGIVPGASLAAGDLNGDGKAEIVIGGGPTTAPWPPVTNGPDQRVVVYHGDGTVVGGFSAYPGVFQGGVRVALADVNGDGRPDMITAPGPGTAPEIGIYSQKWLNGQDQGTRLSHFLAYESSFSGGVNVAAGYWSGKAEIVVAPGPGRPPEVRVFDPQGRLLSSFLAFDASYTGGLSVAVGDLNADGQPEIVVGTLAPPARIQAFKLNGQPYGSLIAPFPADDGNGAQVGVADLNGTGNGLILAAETSGTNPLLEIIDPTTGTVLRATRPQPLAENGLRIGAADLNLDGRDEILIAPGWATSGASGDVQILGPDLRHKSTISVYSGPAEGMTVAGAARHGLPLRADALNLRLTANKRTRFVVARFHDAAGTAAAASSLRATIRWGDTTTTRGTVINRGDGNYDIRATRRYPRAGTYTITVTLTDSQHRISIAHSKARVRQR
jgi:hypothetical protein